MGTIVKSKGGFPELPSIFDDFLMKDIMGWPTSRFGKSMSTPAVNVRETDTTFEIEVAAPGMNKKDFNLEIDNDMLTISASKEMKAEDKDKEGNYTRREFSYQSFQRTFNLPERMVQSDKVSAKYNDGILHITMPKTEEAKVKPAKQISIA